MRMIFMAMIFAAGIGLVGTTGASAAPISGAAIGSAVDSTSLIEKIQRYRRCRCVSRRWDGSCRRRICF
jgi:uncharacterized oligopeptide transporter (OPT) family protein